MRTLIHHAWTQRANILTIAILYTVALIFLLNK